MLARYGCAANFAYGSGDGDGLWIWMGGAFHAPNFAGKKIFVGSQVAFDITTPKAAKDFRCRPDLLETCYECLFFLFVSYMAEQFLVCLHCTINGVLPCMPMDNSKVEVIVSENKFYSLAPYRLEELRSQVSHGVSGVTKNIVVVS